MGVSAGVLLHPEESNTSAACEAVFDAPWQVGVLSEFGQLMHLFTSKVVLSPHTQPAKLATGCGKIHQEPLNPHFFVSVSGLKDTKDFNPAKPQTARDLMGL